VLIVSAVQVTQRQRRGEQGSAAVVNLHVQKIIFIPILVAFLGVDGEPERKRRGGSSSGDGDGLGQSVVRVVYASQRSVVLIAIVAVGAIEDDQVMAVAPVQPRALRPDFVADAKLPSIMSWPPLPVELTVRSMEVCALTPPPVPVTVTAAVPKAAALPAVKVSMDVPDPPAMLVGLKLAVTPDGKPLADNVIALLNPPEGVAVMVEVPVPP